MEKKAASAPFRTPWVEPASLPARLARNEAFWDNALTDGPLVWVTVANARKVERPPLPATIEATWMDVDYVLRAGKADLEATYYAGDALPVYCPWLGPDQFAAWLGAELSFSDTERTTWVTPFIEDWNDHPDFRIDPANRYWQTYLEILRRSADEGRAHWVTGYPDLHTGIDALCAMRGPERLAIDLMTAPENIHRAMAQMTRLFVEVVETVSEIIDPYGQGHSNWTVGWSARRYLCVGQNDFSCLLSPEMFREFCFEDNLRTSEASDVNIYHLDGPGAVRHVDMILSLPKVQCIQWIQGAGAPPPSQWLDLLEHIQAAGRSVQVLYASTHGGLDNLFDELSALCKRLDPNRLFFWSEATSVEMADELVDWAHKVGRRRYG
jgi:hypothetical protein